MFLFFIFIFYFFFILLKIGSVGPVDQQINLVLPKRVRLVPNWLFRVGWRVRMQQASNIFRLHAYLGVLPIFPSLVCDQDSITDGHLLQRFS